MQPQYTDIDQCFDDLDEYIVQLENDESLEPDQLWYIVDAAEDVCFDMMEDELAMAAPPTQGGYMLEQSVATPQTVKAVPVPDYLPEPIRQSLTLKANSDGIELIMPAPEPLPGSWAIWSGLIIFMVCTTVVLVSWRRGKGNVSR